MSNIWSLSDYAQKESQDERVTSSFTGGEHSGLAVESPSNAGTDWSGLVSGPAPEGSKRVIVYKNGFMLEDGAFRPKSDPANEKFLEELKLGIAPKELDNGGKHVYIVLDDRQSEEYKYEASTQSSLFSGSGVALNESTATAAAPVDTEKASVIVDEAKRTTTLQLRFHNGTRKKQRFNEDHTISDLHFYFMQAAPVEGNYKLLEGFPPREVSVNGSLTLKEAGLLQATITQVLL